MVKEAQKLDKAMGQMCGQSLQILGIRLNSTDSREVLSLIAEKIAANEKLWLVTPNPEFLVAAQQDEEFKRRLNQADLAIPDGIGLIFASWFLATKPRLTKRVAGADMVEKIFEIARQKGWKVGIVGARRGDLEQAEELVKRLRSRYANLKAENLEQVRGWDKKDYDLIFACQGMKEQEKWISQNLIGTKAKIFVGVGGSLDFLAGFSRRAPLWMRQIGLEWVWRLLQSPQSHLRRVYTAFVVFPLLVLKAKLG